MFRELQKGLLDFAAGACLEVAGLGLDSPVLVFWDFFEACVWALFDVFVAAGGEGLEAAARFELGLVEFT